MVRAAGQHLCPVLRAERDEKPPVKKGFVMGHSISVDISTSAPKPKVFSCSVLEAGMEEAIKAKCVGAVGRKSEHVSADPHLFHFSLSLPRGGAEVEEMAWCTVENRTARMEQTR
uniref:Uncharacterized protein n=1 Tax=Anopheles coluzzii TaxID=1518534 RepID=A0A6E8W9Q3_ANOCL